MTKINIEENWRQSQIKMFNNNWNDKYSLIFLKEKDLNDKILNLKLDIITNINDAFGKLDKALQICNFLYNLKKSKPPQDTEKIIVTTLISCAEATYRINKPKEIVCENLVKGFFKPVSKQLNYKIKGYIGDNPCKRTFKEVEVLYLIRNDYIHNGNFLGNFFKRKGGKCFRDCFYYSEKNKAQLIEVTSECDITYEEFREIFLEAFIQNIKKYCNKKK